MNTNKFTFDIGFQLQILSLMIKDEAFLLKCSKYLSDDYFENEILGYFFNKTISCYKKYDKLPDLTYFVNEIKKFETQEKRFPYANVLSQIFRSNPSLAQYVKDELVSFIKTNRFVKTYQKIPELYNYESPKAAMEYASKQFEEMNDVNFNEDNIITLKDTEDMVQGIASSSKVAPLGLPIIDNQLAGGIRGEELCTIMGDSNVGKSIALVNIGSIGILRGNRVLHFNLEGRKSIPALRYLSRLSGVEYSKIRVDNLTDKEREILAQVREKYLPYLKIVHKSNFKVTIEDIFRDCKEIFKEWPFDECIIDYCDLLKTEDKMEYRHEQTAVFRGAAKMSIYFERPFFTGTQANRPDKDFMRKKRWVTMRDYSESYEKIRISSTVVSLNRTEKEEAENKLRILLCKNRDGERSYKIGCYSDYSRMKPWGLDMGFYDCSKEED